MPPPRPGGSGVVCAGSENYKLQTFFILGEENRGENEDIVACMAMSVKGSLSLLTGEDLKIQYRLGFTVLSDPLHHQRTNTHTG